MNPKKDYNRILAQKTIEAFSERNITGYYCETAAEAKEKALSLIPAESTVSCGGSETLKQTGMIEALRDGDYRFFDPHAAMGAMEKNNVAHAALSVDYFFMSANAISSDGELVNIDGYGNRVSAMIFGPSHVIVIAGMNKVTNDLNSAINRAKHIAAPKTLLLFRQDYPSFNELDTQAERGSNHLVVTTGSAVKDRMIVILVDEELGF
ncbi:MAG: lactate utilization protein [Anaerofustis sp.]